MEAVRSHGQPLDTRAVARSAVEQPIAYAVGSPAAKSGERRLAQFIELCLKFFGKPQISGQTRNGLRIDGHGVCPRFIRWPSAKPKHWSQSLQLSTSTPAPHPALPNHPIPVRPANPSLPLPSFVGSRLPLNWFGIDRPIAYAIASHVWRVIAGPVGLFLVATFLTRIEQGYYYTFASILGLAVFFELGLDYGGGTGSEINGPWNPWVHALTRPFAIPLSAFASCPMVTGPYVPESLRPLCMVSSPIVSGQ